MMSRMTVLAIVMALGGSAVADEKVDWSQYIDKNPSAPVKSTPVRIAGESKAAPDKPAAKPAAKAKAKAKARAKAKPRTKR